MRYMKWMTQNKPKETLPALLKLNLLLLTPRKQRINFRFFLNLKSREEKMQFNAQ